MKFRIIALVALMCPLFALSQRITYSLPEAEDSRTIDFDIIGKVNGNFLVYKNIRNRRAISVYNNEMGLRQRVELDFMPDRTLNADFIAYPDFAYIFYQYQKRNILHYMAAKVDGNAKLIGEPVELDTT